MVGLTEAKDNLGWYNFDKRDVLSFTGNLRHQKELILDVCSNYQNEISGTVVFAKKERVCIVQPREMTMKYIASISAWISISESIR